MILADNNSFQKKQGKRGVWVAILLFCFLGGCSDQKRQLDFRYSGWTMGTSFTVKVSQLPDGVEKKRLTEEIDQRLVEINDVMSTYIDHSELSRLNANSSTDWISISPELFYVISESRRISERSSGAFDITVGPLVNLWGFGPEYSGEKIPDESEIAAKRTNTGFHHFILRQPPPAIKKDIPNLSLDLSGIAKGYGVDQLAELLEREKIQDYLVEVGGEIRIKGRKMGASPWRIAIEKPLVDQRTVQMILELSDIGMATSGDYRNYLEKDGQHYSHTIDPTSGYPVTHKLASVTVLSQSAMHADAMATAFMVLGPDKGYRLAEAEMLTALFIIKNEKGFIEKATTAFKKLVEK
ncbi:MAG: FAD:protein FMN transferase [Methylococcales bacterium]